VPQVRPRMGAPASTPTGLLSEEEAAKYLGLSQACLRKRRRLGKTPAYIRIGRRILYQLQDLDALIASGRVDPEGGRR